MWWKNVEKCGKISLPSLSQKLGVFPGLDHGLAPSFQAVGSIELHVSAKNPMGEAVAEPALDEPGPGG